PLVCGVAQNGPDSGALPPRDLLARWYALLVEQTGNGAYAQVLYRITLVDETHHVGFGFNNLVISGRFIALAHVTVAVRCTTHYADLSLSRFVEIRAIALGKALERRIRDESVKPLKEVQPVKVRPGQSLSRQTGSESCISPGNWRV